MGKKSGSGFFSWDGISRQKATSGLKHEFFLSIKFYAMESTWHLIMRSTGLNTWLKRPARRGTNLRRYQNRISPKAPKKSTLFRIIFTNPNNILRLGHDLKIPIPVFFWYP